MFIIQKGISSITRLFSSLSHPDNNGLVQETPENLGEIIRETCREWEAAQEFFNHVTDPDLVDQAIFSLGACEKKYVYLLKRARKAGCKYRGRYLRTE